MSETPVPAADPAAPAPAPKKGLGDTAMRFASAGPLVPLIIAMLYVAPKWVFATFIATTVAIIANELFVMTIPESRGLRVWGTVATVGLTGVFAFGDQTELGLGPLLVAALATIAIGTLVCGLAVPDPVDRAAMRSGWLFGGPIYLAATLSHLERLHLLEDGGGWVVMAMMLAWFSDTAAYFAGRWFGKHKLYEKLSPKKTIEGSFGGLFGSVIGALCGHFFLIRGLPLVDAILLGLVAGACGQAGDLFESLLKRSVGVKDSGSILPGHGGLLDRADALMFTALLTSLYATYVLPHRG